MLRQRVIDLFTMFMLFALQDFIEARNPTYKSSESVFADMESHTSTAFQILETAMQNMPKDLKQFQKDTVCKPKPLDCSDIYLNGERKDGLYDIWPQSRVSKGPLQVYCDMDSNGGGWTVIQRRGDYGRNDSYFFKDWNAYKTGFGCMLEDFWIGNDNLFALTNQRGYELRVNLTSWEGETAYASYDQFWISEEKYNYTLHVNGYRGTAAQGSSQDQSWERPAIWIGSTSCQIHLLNAATVIKWKNSSDSLETHHGSSFSTSDRDNTVGLIDCANRYYGAWWYKDCLHSNLNGQYLRGNNSRFGDGVVWRAFKGMYHSLRDTVMKIRPLRSSELTPC